MGNDFSLTTTIVGKNYEWVILIKSEAYINIRWKNN